MQKYFAVFTIVLLLVMIISRVFILKRQGIKAMNFGNTDKTDFLFFPFILFYFYLIFANTFGWPSVGKWLLFRREILSWAGVFLCVSGLALLLWCLISFRKSFRVGIDLNHSDELITTGIFAYSRNPIYVSFGIILIGQFFIYPNWIMLIYFAAGILLFHRQVIREEDFLKKHYGKKYIDYCRRVRRYI